MQVTPLYWLAGSLNRGSMGLPHLCAHSYGANTLCPHFWDRCSTPIRNTHPFTENSIGPWTWPWSTPWGALGPIGIVRWKKDDGSQSCSNLQKENCTILWEESSRTKISNRRASPKKKNGQSNKSKKQVVRKLGRSFCNQGNLPRKCLHLGRFWRLWAPLSMEWGLFKKILPLVSQLACRVQSSKPKT